MDGNSAVASASGARAETSCPLRVWALLLQEDGTSSPTPQKSSKTGFVSARAPSRYQLRVKLLKMYDFPEAKGADLKMWLGVDLRPTSNAAAFVRDLVEGTLSTFGPNSIGLTRTRNLDKHHYNGGLFVYRGRGCVDSWKELIFEPCSLWKHRRKPGPKGECIDAFERGRDQPREGRADISFDESRPQRRVTATPPRRQVAATRRPQRGLSTAARCGHGASRDETRLRWFLRR